MTTRAQDDAMMWATAGLLAVLAVAGIVVGIVLFVKKKPIWGAVVVTFGLGSGVVSIALGCLMIVASFAWH